ncbi:MAG TPA: cyclic pyranopterin monophosphate synthase MoaC [Miltoncostaeaceae bacterium]|nr:cyclic pyranopterin monophosphate synthase MoaC [Miltoncostaeaceae bacterium]
MSSSETGEPALTHLDARGRARMVDVAHKPPRVRRAVAEGHIRVSEKAIAALLEGRTPKGDVAALARASAILAAKRTPELVLLAHPLPLTSVAVDISVDREARDIRVEVTVQTTARTGVEMEALTAVSVAALNVYDMLKGIDPAQQIGGIRLVEKVKGAVEG